MSGIAVGVSGAGSNLRALVAAARRGELGAPVCLVFADRPCAALEWATEAGIETALIPGLAAHDPHERAAADETLAASLRAAGIDAVVLAGYMRIVGPATLTAFAGRILNTHPSLLPAFPGGHAVRDALAHGVAVSGCTVHLVDATLDGGPIVLQESVPVLAGDDEASLHERIKAVEHRLLPRAVGLLLGRAISVAGDGRRVVVDAVAADAALPVPRRALISVSDKTGLVPLASGLVGLGFELVSTGGTARTLREAGLPVTDVAAVTGLREMLDGRVKTLHPAVHAGILADRRRADHREALVTAGIAPFELIVVNLYPFAAAAARPGITLDELVEEIDIGGPTLVRAAAKNHASVTIVTSPARYETVLDALAAPGGTTLGLRSALALEAFGHTAAYDGRIAGELPARMAAAGVELPDEPGLPGASDPYPPLISVVLEKVDRLRYGENPHQTAARYRRAGGTGWWDGLVQHFGLPLSYLNLYDADAAWTLVHDLGDGPAVAIIKHANPCGAAIGETLAGAYARAYEADPLSAFGGIVATNRPIDRPTAARMAEAAQADVVVAPDYEPGVLDILRARRKNTRVLSAPPPRPRSRELRDLGGGVLVQEPARLEAGRDRWRVVTRRAPTEAEWRDAELAWRIAAHVMSNAVVLVRDGQALGIGAGQQSRVAAAVIAADRAAGRAAGGASATDGFYPFPDGIDAAAAAGVAVVVQPGGSVRDAEVIARADDLGLAMLLTGERQFRH